MTDKPNEKAFTGKLEPEDVNYIPLSGTRNKACANCRWFIAGANPSYACFIVDASDPDDEPILPTGVCDRWEAPAEPAPEPVEELAEAIAEALQENADSISSSVGELVDAMPTWPVSDAAMAGKSKRPSFVEWVKSFVPQKPPAPMSVFKGTDGKYYWHAMHTNNFKDLEDEILTTKGHDKYIARLDAGLVPMPVLQAWHIKGSDHGQADVVWRDGHMVHAVGHFADNSAGENARKYYAKNARKLKMSHGFTAPAWAFDGKHYDDYNTIEITTLPANAAANPYTSFDSLEEIKEMAIPEHKLHFLEAVIGKDNAASVAADSERAAKEFGEKLIEYKSFTDATPADKTKDTPEPDQYKALQSVYADLVTGQTNIMDVVVLQSKAIKAGDERYTALETKVATEQAAWQKQLDTVMAQINLTPSRASQNPATVRTEVEKEILKDALPTGDSEAKFFGAKVRA